MDGGADYVLAVKENQGQLYESIRDRFDGAEAFGFDGMPYDYDQTVNKGHGRVERRECWTIRPRTAWTTWTPVDNGPN